MDDVNALDAEEDYSVERTNRNMPGSKSLESNPVDSANSTPYYRGSRYISFVEAVLVRPNMYTLGGTFNEVVAFLEGYYSGLAKGHYRSQEFMNWVNFREWTSNKLRAHDGCRKGGRESTGLFNLFRHLYGPTDDILIVKLLEFANEFHDATPED